MPSQRRRTYACVDCGAVVTRIRRARESMVCLECGMERANEAARALQSRQGPYWDRFRANPGAATQYRAP